MRNNIFQSLKIVRLAILLARAGLPQILDYLPLRWGWIIGKFFGARVTRQSDAALLRFMQSDACPILKLLVSELCWRQDLPAVDLRQSPTDEDFFWSPVARSILSLRAKHSADNLAAYKSFMRRQDMLFDKRLYAAEVEAVQAAGSGCPELLPIEIDWPACSQTELSMHFPPAAKFITELDSSAQTQLSLLWEKMFFGDSALLSNWSEVACSGEQLTFCNATISGHASAGLKNFLVRHLHKGVSPSTYEQYRLTQSLAHLRRLCPQVDLLRLWQSSLSTRYQDSSATPPPQYLQALQQTDYRAGLAEPLPLTDPQDLTHLLKPQDLSRNKRFANSSLVVVWGIAILIYILLKYF